MQSTSEPDDVEHLLDVLGVSGLPYQNFRKPSLAPPPQPMRTTSARIDAAFPLLAAAIPEIEGAVAPHHGSIERTNSITTTAQEGHATDRVAAPLRRPVSMPALPEAPPKSVQATRAQVSAFQSPKRISAPRAQSEQEPLHSVETQIRSVFDMLRGTSRQAPPEEDNGRGINSLFHRR
jgi:hypothetical protein